MNARKAETPTREGDCFALQCFQTLAEATRPRVWGEAIVEYSGEVLDRIDPEEMKSVPAPDSSPGTAEYLRRCDLQLTIVHAFMTVAWEQGMPWWCLRDTLRKARLPPIATLLRTSLSVRAGRDHAAHRAFFGVFHRMLAKVPTQRMYLMSGIMDMIGPIDSGEKAFRAVDLNVVEPGRPVGDRIS